MKLIPTALYLGDNGRCFCGNHAGAVAQATGRDLSGHRIHRVTDADQAYMRSEFGSALECESCRVKVAA